VLLENFRPGVMQRLGLGYDTLKQHKPSLIYCAISGFGQSGPWVERPAYDQIVQGVSGVMSVTGDAQSAPLRVGYPVADTMGGMIAAFAIAAALNAEPRGSFIDVSMLESVLASMGWVVSNHLVAGVEPRANGNENVTSAPSGAFEAADALLNIAANKDEQWQLLVKHLGLDALLDRHEYASRENRKRNRMMLKAELEEVLRTRPAEQWAQELNAIGVPAGPVFGVPDILKQAQITDRGFLQAHEQVPGVGRDVTLATTGFKLDGEAPRSETPPPTLGQHNDQVWRELGLSEQELQQLREEDIL